MNMFLPKEIGPIYTEYELEDWFAPRKIDFSVMFDLVPDAWHKRGDDLCAAFLHYQREESVMLLTELGRGEG